MIDVKGLKKNYGGLQVLKGVDLTINKGDCVVLVGPSGCGKSTFLRCLNRLEEPDGGHIIFNGKEVTDHDIDHVRQKMGMVFQHFNLFPHLTIRRNITIAPVKNKIMTQAQADKRADELLAMVGLSDKADAYPAQLSGGQKQRLSIARALAKQAPVLVLDDSTSALDMETEYEIQSHLAEKKDVSKIIIAHRISSVQSADEILYLDHGRIAERGTHESLMAQKGLYYSTWEAQYGDYHKAKAALEQALPANA